MVHDFGNSCPTTWDMQELWMCVRKWKPNKVPKITEEKYFIYIIIALKVLQKILKHQDPLMNICLPIQEYWYQYIRYFYQYRLKVSVYPYLYLWFIPFIFEMIIFVGSETMKHFPSSTLTVNTEKWPYVCIFI